jgi:hypothetical protein
MKDVPENELLSAYLDGELTAAERAEVEHFLARSPDARQLVEEFRALGSTLQSLPQSKLGEDLGQQVLRIAQRRMFTQSAAPGELSRPAVMLPAAILRWVLNPQAWVWSSLAVAIGVMLTVINWGPADRPASDGIAKVPAAEREGGRMPEIGAAPNVANLQGGLADAPQAGTSGRTTDAPPTASPAAVGGHAARDFGSDLAPMDVRAKSIQGAVQVSDRIGQKIQSGPGGPISHPAGRSPPPQWDILVHCKISPKAHRQQAFNKALADNEIVWDDTRAKTNVLTGTAAVAQGQPREPAGQQTREAPEQPAAKVRLAETVDFVYVEAPWAQLRSMLAALEAQPEAFALVSFEPAPEGEGSSGPRRYAGVQMQSQEGGGTGVSHGVRAEAPAGGQPSARLQQHGGDPREVLDEVGPRAYARRISLPATDLDLLRKPPNENADLTRSVALALGVSQPQAPESSAQRIPPVPPGQPPGRRLHQSRARGTPHTTPAEPVFNGRNAKRLRRPLIAGPMPPAGQTPKPEQPTVEKPQQHEIAKKGTQTPLVRALLVFHVADVNPPAAASLEERHEAGTMSPKGHEASPPAAVED